MPTWKPEAMSLNVSSTSGWSRRKAITGAVMMSTAVKVQPAVGRMFDAILPQCVLFAAEAGRRVVAASGRVALKRDGFDDVFSPLLPVRAFPAEAISPGVSTRLYLTRDEDWDAAGAAHGAVFDAMRPALTMAQVARLIHPAMLVAIEAVAVIGSAAPD